MTTKPETTSYIQDQSKTASMNQHHGKKNKDSTCKVHGVGYVIVGEDSLLSIKFCPVCTAEQGIERAKTLELEEKEKQKKDEAHRLNSIGLGERFLDVTWESYKPQTKKAEETKKQLMDYAAKFEKRLANGTSLIFYGNPGTGKNHLAACIAKQITTTKFTRDNYDGYRTVRFITASKLTRIVKSCWNNHEKDEQKEINSFTYPDLLIIDEVGLQLKNQADKLYLNEVINNRYEAIKSTIFLTNLPIDECAELLGGRIIDRLKQGDGRIFNFNWESYRELL